MLTFSLAAPAGCATQRELRTWRDTPVPLNPPVEAAGVVFAADGAGDFRISSSQLRKVVQEECVPLHVLPFVWSHGYGMIVADQMSQVHACWQGRRLAAEVVAYHQEHPNLSIALYAHSAGCNVVLAAMQNMPPGIVDRVFLLSAASPTCYDLRPALRAVNKGIYVYYSKYDCLYLSIAMRLLGKLSKECTDAGGRVGFRVCVQSPEDLVLYAKLYQRGWTRSDMAYGNRGDHYGNYHPDFIRAYILPIILGAEPNFPPAVCPQAQRPE